MRKCEKCEQYATEMNLFICRGQMVCQSCFMQATDNNKIFIDETKYPRVIDSLGNIIAAK